MTTHSFFEHFFKYERTFFSRFVFLVNWIAFLQSNWFFMERPLLMNFLSQNIGSSKIFLQYWSIFLQTSRSSCLRLQKIFSVICLRPGLLKIILSIISNKFFYYIYRLQRFNACIPRTHRLCCIFIQLL